MFRLTTLLCTILLVLSSCQKDLNYSDDNYQAKLVVNAVFSPEDLWSIHLCRTNSIFENRDIDLSVTDAVIRVEDLSDNTEIQFEHKGDGHYRSIGFTPQPGHSYEIFVDSEKYGKVYSSTYVPSVGEVSNINVETVQFKEQSVYKIDLEITDLPFQDNYYVWQVVAETEEDRSLKIFAENDISSIEDAIEENAPLTFNPKTKGEMVFSETETTSDSGGEQFNTSIFAVPPQSSAQASEGNDVEFKIKLKLRAVSEDLFLHLKSLEELNLINSSNNQPTVVYSNIQDGYGIFGAFTEEIITIK